MARILVTNDDGITNAGVWKLAAAALRAGHQVTLAAPSMEWSGGSASIGSNWGERLRFYGVVDPAEVLTNPELLDQDDIDALAGLNVCSVEASPARIVLAGGLGIFGDVPDLVLAGVNPGLNTGSAVLFSGTVGAVMTAAVAGRKGAAFSVQYADVPRFDAATQFVSAVAEWLIEAPKATALSINVPNRAPEEVRGLKWAGLTPRAGVRSAVEKRDDGGVSIHIEWLGGEHPEGTDAYFVSEGFASICALRLPDTLVPERANSLRGVVQ